MYFPLHCKKGYGFSRLQPGCHLLNSAWPGIIKLFPARGSVVSDIPSGDAGKPQTFFYSVQKFLAAGCLCPKGTAWDAGQVVNPRLFIQQPFGLIKKWLRRALSIAEIWSIKGSWLTRKNLKLSLDCRFKNCKQSCLITRLNETWYFLLKRNFFGFFPLRDIFCPRWASNVQL